MKLTVYPPPLPEPQLKKLIKKAQAGDIEARNLAVLHNMRLVCLVAKDKYKSSEINDVLQEGAIALMNCIEKFDLSRGTRFSTYAVWAIRNRFTRFYYQRKRVTDHESVGNGDCNMMDESWEPDDLMIHKDELKEAMGELKSREIDVLMCRVDNIKFDTIAARLSVSRERVRQIERRALEKLSKKVGSDKFISVSNA